MMDNRSRFFQLALVLVCLDHVACFIVNADHGGRHRTPNIEASSSAKIDKRYGHAVEGGIIDCASFDLPEAQRNALLLGDWSAHVGQVFSEWNYKLHTCDPFPVPKELPMWRGADDGYASPACVLWFLNDEIHDRIFVVNELYQRGLTPEELGNIGLGSESGKGGRADIMNSLGCRWQPSVKGEGSRIAGKSLVHARLAPKSDGWPGLIVTRNCRNLIRELPALCYDRRRPEDVDTDSPDHSYDALRYGLSRKRYTCKTIPVVGI